MTERARERETHEATDEDDDAISVGWRRIWVGAGLLAVASVIQFIGAVNEEPGVLLVTVPCAIFGVVFVLIGAAAEGVLLAERSKAGAHARAERGRPPR